MKIKKYPQPNPAVPGSTSRFASAVQGDQDGNKADIIEEARFTAPLYAFHYDSKSEQVNFKPTGNAREEVIPPYLPSPDLVELIRLAQILQRPILIKGEPGSGKTQFARSVAYEWYGPDYKKHFFEWTIKSTSKAIDGLYTFDHVARLRDAYLVRQGSPAQADEDNLERYRTFGPMGQAFLTSTEDAPSILLIDEVDKADVDFPNDLLLELDERRFQIPAAETGELIVARYPPLIFITSNDERELPEAFLRRCLFLYIHFPDHNALLRIVRAHLPTLASQQGEFVTNALEYFRALRDDILKDPNDNKRISTSELLDWLRAYDFDARTGLKLQQALDKLPVYYQALLKTYQSVYRRTNKNVPLS